ncbi:RHS repeat-associated core domain-containing protein [Flavobacterium covae]
MYGKTRKIEGDQNLIPFLYQGQYYDHDIELAYNLFRYYNPETGTYISQDPIGLLGGNELYAYVQNSNIQIDKFGWYSDLLDTGMGHHLMPRSVAKKLDITELAQTNSIAWYPNNGVNTATLHGEMHTNLINEGVPYHGSKFTGTVDDFFDKGAKAYKDIDTKGFLKIPGTKEKLFKNLTPGEALDKIKELFDSGSIPCK